MLLKDSNYSDFTSSAETCIHIVQMFVPGLRIENIIDCNNVLAGPINSHENSTVEPC